MISGVLYASQQKHNTQTEWFCAYSQVLVSGSIGFYSLLLFSFASISCAHFHVFDSNELNREEIIIIFFYFAHIHLACIYFINFHFYYFLFYFLVVLLLLTVCLNQFCAGICCCSIGWRFAAAGSVAFDSIESADQYQSRHNWQSHHPNVSTPSASWRIGMFVSWPCREKFGNHRRKQTIENLSNIFFFVHRQCLNTCCMRSPEAGIRLGTSSVGLMPLAASATGTGIRSRILALQLLTIACDKHAAGYSSQKSFYVGHLSVSEALSTLRLHCGEPVRFRLLVGMMNSGGGTGELQYHGLKFVNTFLDSAENIQNRLYLQAELYQAGFDPTNMNKVNFSLLFVWMRI